MNILKTFLIWSGLLINFTCFASDVNELPDFEELVQDHYIAPFKNAEVDRYMQIFTDDAIGMHNTLPPFIGKEAIAQFATMVATNLNIEQMDVVVDEVRVNGSWALTRGSFTSKFIPKGMTDSSSIKVNKGKFILLWERQQDGDWKVILDMGNNSEASSPPA
jgi:ketosteroid isomerase-like protein